MTRFWQSLGILILALSVQGCGKSGSNGTPTVDAPPPNLASYTATAYDSSFQPVELAEKRLCEHNLKFVVTKEPDKTVIKWDRTALVSLLKEHPDKGMEDQLPLLEDYAKVLGAHLATYGKGYYRLENGQKKLILATDEPILSLNLKLQATRQTIERIKKNSLEGEGANPNVAS